MPLKFILTDSTICFQTTGDVEYSEGLTILNEAMDQAEMRQSSDPRGWHLLFDISESTENRESNEMQNIAAVIQARRQSLSGRCAVVATDPLHFGLARMFASYLESLGVEAMVKRDKGLAEDWLLESVK